ncbi:hypothetical protein LCGC14_2190210 [marine sediment metagenome]|uniref:Uncharacterized protein n=1 Tax=marine sediment metagenome TaxID=412755 RepID=A0A0F9FX54_9ZZZZ
MTLTERQNSLDKEFLVLTSKVDTGFDKLFTLLTENKNAKGKSVATGKVHEVKPVVTTKEIAIKGDQITMEPISNKLSVDSQIVAQKAKDGTILSEFFLTMQPVDLERFLVSIWHHRSRQNGIWPTPASVQGSCYRLYYLPNYELSDREVNGCRKCLAYDKKYIEIYDLLQKNNLLGPLPRKGRDLKENKQ